MENRLTPLDQWIRQMLEDLEAPASESRWDLLRQQLEEEGINPSDAFLASVFADWEASDAPSRWDLMEARLEQEPDLDPETADFDAALRSRLENVEPPIDPSGWTAMEAALDEEEDPTSPIFDQQAASKLERIEPAFQPQHWERMARQLDDVFSLRHMLYRYKVAEVGILLLLLLTLINFWPADRLSFPSERSEQPEVIETAPEAESAETTPHLTKSSVVTEGRTSENEQPVASSVVINTVDERSPETTSSRGLPLLPARPLLALSSPPDLSQVIQPSSRENSHGSDEPIAAIGSELIPLPEATPGSTSAAQALPAGGMSSWRIGLLGAMDYNLIFTPRDEILGTPSYSVDSINYNTGVTLGRTFGHWEVESGLAYSLKSYRPRTPILQYGTFDYLVIEKFTGIQLHLLQVPLRLRYYLKPANHDWNVYGDAGLMANFLVQPEYEIQVQEVYSASAAKPPPSPSEREEVLDQSKLNEKSFPDGLRAGGRTLANTFMTGHLGIGLEKRVWQRSFLFLQGSYQRPLTNIGFGPNRDRINTISAQVGIRYVIPYCYH